MVRQFMIHQKVRLSGEGNVSNKHLSPDGVYEITRLMPEDQAGVFHYRIRSPAGELVMRESQLVADAPPPGSPEHDGPAKSPLASVNLGQAKERAQHLMSLVRALAGSGRLPKPRKLRPTFAVQHASS